MSHLPAAIWREMLFASRMQMLPQDVTTALGHTDASASSANNLEHMAARIAAECYAMISYDSAQQASKELLDER